MSNNMHIYIYFYKTYIINDVLLGELYSFNVMEKFEIYFYIFEIVVTYNQNF